MSFSICPLTLDILTNGNYLSLMGQLTVVGKPSNDLLISQYAKIFESGNHFIYVAIDNECGDVVASATLVVEYKIIRQCQNVGHIEDVVTDSRFRGRGLAGKILSKLEEIAREHNCYKLILDCSESNCPVYEKNGFVKKEVQMRKDLS